MTDDGGAVTTEDGALEAASDDEAYLRSIEDLLGMLLEDVPFHELLDQVVDLTARAVVVADAVAVTVERVDGRTDTAAASDDASRHLDEVQRALGEGPCVDAMRSGDTYVVEDLRTDERWSIRLREALSTRAVIEQAKGILMVRVGCGEDEAFALLRRTSQHQNRKLREVAAAVVAMREELPTAGTS